MITVVANLAWLVPGDVGGSEEYTTRLLAAAGRLAPTDIDLRILGHPLLPQAHPELRDLAFDPLPGPLRRRAYRLVAESTVVARRTRGADVVHHFGGRLPARRSAPAVVTIHDLQPLEAPWNFSRRKVAYLRWALPRSARAAELVCVPSQWVADTVVERFDVAADKVRVVPSTWDSTVTALDTDGLLAQLGEGPVIAFPAAGHPHKNHETLLAAAERLRVAHPDLTVVLTGGPGRAEKQIRAAASRAGCRVLRPGRVSPSTVQALLARADVMAFPSRYEGFGLPVIEAMRCETPVVVASTPVLTEVAGDAALRVGPDDVDGWVEALEVVLTDGAVRDRLVAAGAERAATHSPERAGERLLAVWREVG